MSEKAKTSHPTVSVNMPTYNSARHIEEAIESVLNQTYEDWELVIVDDGSIDHTPDILARYADRDARIKVHRMEHGGRGKARNKCLEYSSGKYIAINDSDDVSLPDRLAKQVRLLDRCPEIGVVSGSRVTWIDDDSQQLFTAKYPETPEEIQKTLKRNKMRVLFGSSMIRVRLFKEFGGFDEELLRSEDYGFFKRIHGHTVFTTLPGSLVMCRTAGLTVSREYFYEYDAFVRYATYRAKGGLADFDEFYSRMPASMYQRYITPARYLWYQLKRRVLGLDMS